MEISQNQYAFFELLRAGLWEKEARLSRFKDIDYAVVIRLSEEQSVMGLIASGLEHVVDSQVPKENVLSFVGATLQLEQRSLAMNAFVAKLIDKLRQCDVYTLVVKGQGIAQCYERPLWRACGDVDLLLSEDNYEKAKGVLFPLATNIEDEYKSFQHVGMTIPGGFVVELHGTMHCRLSKRIDKVIDETQNNVFYGGSVRSWLNGNTTVFLPAPNNDVIFVFTHILQHFYIEGIGLRQICDWCRLLWTYRSDIDVRLLEQRIRRAGLLSEWRAFAALAVGWLGMPVEAMPLYSYDKKWTRKAERIMEFVLETGNFGHNRQATSGKVSSAWRKTKDFARHVKVFPLDSLLFFPHFVINGLKEATSK